MIYDKDLPYDVLDEVEDILHFLNEIPCESLDLSTKGAYGLMWIIQYIKEGVRYAKELMDKPSCCIS